MTRVRLAAGRRVRPRAPTPLAALVGLVGLVAGACGQPAIPPTRPEPTLSADLSFSCGEDVFPAAALTSPEGAEAADAPPAAALRRYLRSGAPAAEDLPLGGYRILRADDARVLFATSGLSGGMLVLEARNESEVWRVSGPRSCAPRLSVPGLHAATWRLAPGAPLPGADAVAFVALVSEVDCVSGKSAEGRVLPPVVIREAARVLVVFAVRPPPSTGFETCPAAPPTPVEVPLGGPLGPRALLDGGVFPPAEVESPVCCG